MYQKTIPVIQKFIQIKEHHKKNVLTIAKNGVIKLIQTEHPKVYSVFNTYNVYLIYIKNEEKISLKSVLSVGECIYYFIECRLNVVKVSDEIEEIGYFINRNILIYGIKHGNNYNLTESEINDSFVNNNALLSS